MDLPRLRAHPIGFLWHYVRRHPWGHATVFLSVLVAVVCAVSVQYGLKHLIDIVAAGPGKDGRVCGGVRAAVRAGRRRQPAVARRRLVGGLHLRGGHRRHHGATCSAISPATRRATSPSACRARWPAASPRPSNAAFITENTGSWNVLPPCVAVVCSIIFIGFGEPDDGGRAGRRGRRAGRAGVLPRAPRHAAASQLRRQGRGGRRRAGRRDRQHGRGARVRRDVPRAAAHRRHDRRRDGRAPQQPDLSGAAAADPCRASPRR